MTPALLERPTVGYKHPRVDWNGLTVTDLFCGAGGSSSGLVAAGYRVVIAANHWARAIESHQINHPETDHSQADISQVDPRYFPRTDVLWASPECTNHSIAKGVKRQQAMNEALFELDGTRPLEDAAANRSRATMWDVPRFAEVHKYRAIIIENVVDAYRWIMFPAWLQAMELLGYRHEIVYLNSMHAQAGGLPAPQSRDRMYIVFWRKDAKRRPELSQWTRPLALCAEHGEVRAVQAFKKAERWGRYRAQYVYRCPKCGVAIEPGWLPAASIIDWSIPAPRIGDRAKPLADKTRERIRKGIQRHWTDLVVEAAGNAYDSTDPKHRQHGDDDGYIRAWPTDEALRTLHTTASKGLAVPPLIVRGEGNTVPSKPVTEALGSVTASGSMFLATPLIVNNLSGADASRSTRVSDALPSIVAGGNHAALLVPVEGREGKNAAPTTDPMRTQSTRAETALLVPYYSKGAARATSEPMGTVTTVDSAGLVVPLRNHGVAKPITHPIDTVSAEGNHHALVMRNNLGGAEMTTPVTEPLRTLTTGGHQSVLEPSEPVSLDVDDAGFRMLEPHEIQLGMGFARDYVLLGSKREQVKQAGNAVTPPAARDLGHAVAAFLNGTDVAA
ncbi:DNA cytosine methyltransferase [Microbacterium sp. cx-59]|uniref:DNA cytosine methyltransferase n=1 Tax=Microbacterium sp. cx-59 TaxID=2891207 RepID=UPI001E50E87A|nr:DNA cytosine methyltransferase [Microbacterium sp. cx-59]MCC4906941.1 DNA cytosine methyltransferase [Microbacterium sp. cx-59]